MEDPDKEKFNQNTILKLSHTLVPCCLISAKNVRTDFCRNGSRFIADRDESMTQV